MGRKPPENKEASSHISNKTFDKSNKMENAIEEEEKLHENSVRICKCNERNIVVALYPRKLRLSTLIMKSLGRRYPAKSRHEIGF